jgi:hypothetical protein
MTTHVDKLVRDLDRLLDSHRQSRLALTRRQFELLKRGGKLSSRGEFKGTPVRVID